MRVLRFRVLGLGLTVKGMGGTIVSIGLCGAMSGT